MELYVNPQITGFRQEVDGTIKELKIGSNKEDAYANIIEQGAAAKLEKNKTATINVSTYTEPVEITPTSGKDGMKKATITLSNIPSGGSATAYAWTSSYYGTTYFDFDNAPQDASAFYEDFMLSGIIQEGKLNTLAISHPSTVVGLVRTSDTEFTIGVSQGGSVVQSITFTRDATKDVTLWQVNE